MPTESPRADAHVCGPITLMEVFVWLLCTDSMSSLSGYGYLNMEHTCIVFDVSCRIFVIYLATYEIVSRVQTQASAKAATS